MEKIHEMAQKKMAGLLFGARAPYKKGMRFGEKVLKLMEKHGHSQAELARLIGTQPSSISNVTLGKQNLRPKQLLKLARLYSISMESLVDDSMELVETDPMDLAIMTLIKLMGPEEALRRLSATLKSDQSNQTTRYPWGQMERTERPKNGGEGSDPKKGRA